MTLINPNYSTVLPSQGDVVNDLSGITARANAQLNSTNVYNNTKASTNFDLALFDKNASHQTISVNTSATKNSIDSLDSLVNSILSQIGHEMPDVK